MIVLDSDNTTHTIYIIPRTYNLENDHTITIKNDDTKVETTPSNTKSLYKGYVEYVFDLTVQEGNSFSYKITDDTTAEVLHRGKLFCTAQVTQNYKIHG